VISAPCIVMISSQHSHVIAALHRELQIPADYAARTRLPMYEEVALSELVVAQLDESGRPLVLTQRASEALAAMRAAAHSEGIELLPFSGFRSYLYQRGLLAAKLKKGISIEEILKVLAAPGYSEHHTGEAVDITTVQCPQAEEVFETTDAYRWLAVHAKRFGFSESYPRSNPHNLVYEPWHWRYSPS
jgi:D-alanyl-D-alanine carboxypeptidase